MKNLFAAMSLLLTLSIAQAQTGKVFNNLSLPSKILKTERKYSVYLPPDYETSDRDYPILYLLHGAGDDQRGWVQFGELLNITDKAIKEGKATPMIIVIPDAHTGIEGYMNVPGGSWNYEDYFFKEFMPFIEKKYRVRADKRFRAIAGLSMGGGGSYYYALHHPELFSSACPLSAVTGPLTLEDAKGRYIGNSLISDSLAIGYYNNYSVLNLISKIPNDQKNAVRWYIDCGDDDFLYEGNALVHIAMRKKGIPHEYRVRDGGHTWTYWRTALPSVLEFISQSFHYY